MEITHTISAVLAILAAVAFAADDTDAAKPSSCAQLADIAAEARTDETRFETTAQIIAFADHSDDGFYAADSSGAAHFGDKRIDRSMPLRLGATYRLRGVVAHRVLLWCDSCEFISDGTAPETKETTAERFLSGADDNRPVMLRGVVRDVFRDENDPRFLYMPLLAGNDIVYTAFMSPAGEDRQDLVGAEVLATGICSPTIHENRRQIGRTLHMNDASTIKVLKAADYDPFDVPELGNLRRESPSRIALLGRRRTSGHVLAAWNGCKMLLKTHDGDVVNVELSNPPAPEWGSAVDVAGFPETDLFRLNLVRAVWRECKIENEECRIESEDCATISPHEIMTDEEGRNRIDPLFHGKTIRLAGRVATLPDDEGGRLNLECDNYIVPIETPRPSIAELDLVPGCTVEATGVCVMETENWRPNSVFPRMKGFFLVVRSADGLRVLSRPPWWTPERLMALVGALLLAIVAVLVWNRSLKRLSERRGRELLEEQLTSLRSELKCLERTGLATELHDAISQNLTGISMELRTIDTFRESLPGEVARHLDIASRTLSSCRNELRNVLHDLRNNALESATMDEALKIALAPHVGDAELSVSFSAPREVFTEKSANAVLHIVRELVSNAVRHGGARHIEVVGALDGDVLKFSVSDDGCGFDPETRLGPDKGHFGLQGVQERIETFGGTFAIKASPGRGTTVTATLNINARNCQK